MDKNAYDPTRVSAQAMSRLAPADREDIVFSQQAFIPLSGEQLKKLIAASKEATNVRS